MTITEKKKLAYQIGFGLVDAFAYWHIFTDSDKPRRNKENEGALAYRDRIEELVKQLAAEFLSEF